MPDPRYGLDCEAPWCDKILDGEKTIETRKYRLPAELIGQRIWLLESGGEENVPSLGDEVLAGSQGARIVGSVTFIDVKKYTSQESWAADADKHRVPEDSPYAFHQKPGPAYGWVVGATERLPQPLPLPQMRRISRSIYEVSQAPVNA
ncbi:g12493 [Coccomyxa viridis]|uniref:G12493 protein n=1 Tax=Coccomyxa viridis TaxID=1274662 RepID=A0ABP1GD33_9CHLO